MVKIKGVLNDVSDELLNEIEKLEPGQLKTFQCLWGVKVHDATNEAAYELAFGKHRFNLKDKIYDPYQKKTVDIGVPNVIDGDRVLDFKKFAPGETEAKFLGKFSLSGDNVDDIETFEFLMLSNWVKNNKHRNKSVEPRLELLQFDGAPNVQPVQAPRTVEIKPKTVKKDVAVTA